MPGLASTGGSSEQAGAPSAAQFAEDQKQAAQPMLAQSGSPSVNIIAPEFSGREQQQEQEEEETKPTPAASDMPKTQEQEQDDKPKDAEDVWDALEESSEDLAEHEEAPDYEDYSDEEIVDALIERQEQLRESAGEDHSMAGDGTGSIDYIFGSGPRRAPKGGCTCEFSIYTMSAQGKPRLRMDSADDILVLWQTPGEVTGRRFNLQGLAKGDEFRVAEAADYSYDGPEISSNPSGVDIEVQEHRGPHGTKACLTVQVFSDGSPQDREILLPSDSFDAGLEPDVAVNAAGDFVIAWQSFRPGAAGWDVYAARFNACGDLQGRPFRVNQYTQGDQVSPSVAVDSKRNFIVVWRSLGQDGDRGGIFGRRFDSSGRTLMPERRINLRPAGDQQHPAVAMNDDGSFIIVWACDNPADKDFWLVGGIYDERGIPLCISH